MTEIIRFPGGRKRESVPEQTVSDWLLLYDRVVATQPVDIDTIIKQDPDGMRLAHKGVEHWGEVQLVEHLSRKNVWDRNPLLTVAVLAKLQQLIVSGK